MKTLKVLIVDDNQEGCETMKLLFEALQHRAEVVFDGQTAIEKVLAWLPDLILLDIGMPGMNGWEVTKVLRKMPKLDSIKIYALTGYGDAADVQKSFEVGMNYHFVKPLDFDEFWRIIALQGVC